MKAKKIISVLFCVCTFFTSINVSVKTAQAEPTKLTTAWLSEYETFIVWYAKKQGWDKEYNLDIDMLKFNSGKEIADGQQAYDWQIAALGAVPALLSALSDKFEIIAIASDESTSVAIYTPANSPFFKVKAHNPAFPDIYGSPEEIKGKKFFTTQNSSAHYLLISWLQTLGMSVSDVKINFFTQQALLGTMKNNLADAYALWAPYTIEAEHLNFKPLVVSSDIKLIQPIVLVVSKEFAKENAKEVQNFLKIFMRGIETLKNTPAEKLADDYMEFTKSFVGIEISKEEAIADLSKHAIFTLDEQISMFDNSKNKSDVEKILADIINFYSVNQNFDQETKDNLLKLENINNSYLNFIKEVTN